MQQFNRFIRALKPGEGADRWPRMRLAIGCRIVVMREARGWSQGELAQRIGVSRTMVTHYEDGSNAPSTEKLVALSEALEVNLHFLLTGHGTGNVPKPAVRRAGNVARRG